MARNPPRFSEAIVRDEAAPHRRCSVVVTKNRVPATTTQTSGNSRVNTIQAKKRTHQATASQLASKSKFDVEPSFNIGIVS